MMSPRTLECLLWLRLLLTILVWGFFSLSNKNFFFFFFKPFYGSPVKLVDKQNLFLNLFFYWRIIALQNFISFCQTSTWISHRYTYIPSLMNLPPSPSPSPLGWYRAPVWVSWAILDCLAWAFRQMLLPLWCVLHGCTASLALLWGSSPNRHPQSSGSWSLSSV